MKFRQRIATCSCSFAVRLTLVATGRVGHGSSWTELGFTDFLDGQFTDAESNPLVSATGRADYFALGSVTPRQADEARCTIRTQGVINHYAQSVINHYPQSVMKLLSVHCRAVLLQFCVAFAVLAFVAAHAQPLSLGPGPHLFLDDHLIAEQSFVTRVVNRPDKHPDPVITGRAGGDDNFQPYIAVLRDQGSGRFRAWFNTPETFEQSHIGYLESADGIHWDRPRRLLRDPQKIRFCVSVLDRGVGFAPAADRYLLSFYERDGMKIATSPDGIDWRMLAPETVWVHNHDIDSLHWDPLRRRYLAIGSVKVNFPGETSLRRIPYETVSNDLRHWQPMWPIIAPKPFNPLEKGETQFYSMSGVIARGDLLIGLVKVLRDDLNATPGKSASEMGDLNRKAAGLGYTVLAWTHDGEHWQRDDQPFLLNDPDPARWDHAMAWGDAQLIVGSETYIYYAGYARGHKVARLDERQFGLARMPRDRYVAREADINTGHLLTKALALLGTRLTVNARVAGTMRCRITDESGKPLEGFDWTKIRGDSVVFSPSWSGSIASLAGRAVRLEFELSNAQLFGFDLQ